MGCLTAGFRMLVLLALAAAPAHAATALSVIPFPGTPDASPRSQIIFSTLHLGDLRSVSVRGSRSGGHAGRLVGLPAGRGTAFVPARPFAQDERVTVSARLARPGAAPLSYAFQIATSASEALTPSTSGDAGIASADRRIPRTPTQTVHSVHDLHPPVVRVSGNPDQRSGDIFLTSNNSPQVGPLILDSRGRLVWFHPVPVSAFNLEVQRYHGRRVLTWWQGSVIHGYGRGGADVIYNHSYQAVAVLHGGYGYSSDLHEFQLTPQGTALIDAYVPVHANLSSVGGPTDGTVMDCIIQELDVKTGRVLWEWHALGHIPLGASHAWVPSTRNVTFDFFHLNSIQQQPGHRLLISARNTWSVYLIDERTGKVIWTLGGKNSNFRMGSGTNFEWQHDARLHGNTLSLFDDGALPQEESESSAKRLVINHGTRSVSLLRRFTHSPPLLAGAEGNAELLLGGRMFVGWGSATDFSEYAANGRQIFNGTFFPPVNSYRAFRFHWTGHPSRLPGMAVVPGPNGRLRVYASWNGATQVASWRVLAGAHRGALHGFRRIARRHFETRVRLRTEPAFLAVQALDSSGHVLATSAPHPDPPHLAIFGPHAFVPREGGPATLPVGCLSSRPCHVKLTISSGHSVLGRGPAHLIAGGQGGLVPFTLSASGRRMLIRSANRRLPVRVSVHTASGRHASTRLILVPYSAAGPSSSPSPSQSPTVQLIGSANFVSSSGTGGVLAACYAPVSCHIRATLSYAGTVIARTKAESLGARELGRIGFQLSRRGRAAVAGASGNRLPVQVTLANGHDVAEGQIDLIGYR